MRDDRILPLVAVIIAVGAMVISLYAASVHEKGSPVIVDNMPTKTDTPTNLGATGNEIPTAVALFETTLATSISSSATSMTLTSATDKAGTSLASSTYPFIIDEGTASEEMVIADCTATACTNMIRGLSMITGTSTVASLQKAHRRGASVKITDGPQLLILSRLLNGQGGLPNLLRYQSGTACSGSSSNSNICDKAYIDGVAVAGASNANETTKGILEIATAAETGSSTLTGSTGARLALSTTYATSSPYTAGSWTMITMPDGKMSQSFIDFTKLFTFTGGATFSGSTATTTISTKLCLGSFCYTMPTLQGATSTVLGIATSTVNNGSQSGLSPMNVSRTLEASSTLPSISNSSSELPLWGSYIPADTLCTFGGCNGTLKLTLRGNANCQGQGPMHIYLYYGSLTTPVAGADENCKNDANLQGFMLEAILVATSTNNQRGFISANNMKFSTVTSSPIGGFWTMSTTTPANFTSNASGYIATNAQAQQQFRVTAKFDTGNSNSAFTPWIGTLEVIKP